MSSAATQFKPGQSGNPNGKPKGSRNKLGEQFLADMYADWKEHGVATIEAVRTQKPDAYLKVVASILPRDLNLNVNKFENVSDDELVGRLRDLQSIIEPFLAKGGDGNSGGAEETTRH